MQKKAEQITKKLSALRIILWTPFPWDLSPFKYIISQLCVWMVSETASLALLRQNFSSRPLIPSCTCKCSLYSGRSCRLTGSDPPPGGFGQLYGESWDPCLFHSWHNLKQSQSCLLSATSHRQPGESSGAMAALESGTRITEVWELVFWADLKLGFREAWGQLMVLCRNQAKFVFCFSVEFWFYCHQKQSKSIRKKIRPKQNPPSHRNYSVVPHCKEFPSF